jgi:hypothetical protein
MDLICYPRLSTRSKRALVRQKTSWGNLYTYRPRGHLLQRLSKELNMPIKKVAAQLHKERYKILRSGVIP